MGKLVYKIGGVDISDFVEKRSVAITNRLGRRSDQCRFNLIDKAQTTVPIEGQELVVEQDSSRVFGGIIARPNRFVVNPAIDGFKVDAQDFGKLLDKKLVVQSYVGPQPAGDIIKDIITNFVEDPSIDVTNVQDGPDIDFIAFNYRTARQAIEEIARLTSFTWYIDENKKLFYVSKSTNQAPFQIGPDENRYRALQIRPDSSQLANRVIVRGGSFASDPFTQEWTVQNTNSIPLAYQPIDTPTVDRAGPKSVGIKNVDAAGTFDFLFDANERTLEYDALSSNNQTVEITYSYRVPILVQVEDAASISEVAAIEDSDGVYEKIIVDDSIETLDAARDRAAAEIERFGRPLYTGSFKTRTKGFRSGQNLEINFPAKGINLSLQITSVTFRSDGNGQGEYTVQFGSFNFALEDFLLDLFENGRKIVVREGEVLDVLDTINEAFPMGDALTLCQFRAPPFTWGPGGANPTVYGQGEWA